LTLADCLTPARAEPIAQRAWTLADRDPVPPAVRGEVLLALARIHGDRAQVIKARELLRAGGPSAAEPLARAEAWLAAHR
jgi:hypothetical protein